MTVIAEFTLPARAFVLGNLLTTANDFRITLEQVVPTGPSVMPYFWVKLDAAETEAFEQSVRSDPLVARLEALDRLGSETLYTVEWESVPDDLLDSIVQSHGAILRGGGTRDRWQFLVRFPDHAHLTTFNDHLAERDISIDVGRVYTPSGDDQTLHLFDLTDDQRETLLAAVRRGYFEVPRRVTATELASELGISHQAVSERVRRATNTVLGTVLFGDWDADGEHEDTSER